MTYQEKVKWISECHKGVIPNVWHYFRPKQTPPYALWQEDGANIHHANNGAAEFAVTGTTDYFSKTEFDPAVDDIQAMFEKNGFAWTLNSVQYEEDTGLIHFEWAWEV